MRISKLIIIKTLSIGLLLLIFTVGGVAETVPEPEEFTSSIQFVNYIYHNYADANFEEVYRWLAPGIQAVISEADYLEFQLENKEKYKLELQQIKVSESIKKDEPAVGLKEYLVSDDLVSIYEVEVNYQLNFRRLGKDQQKDITKVVSVLENKPGSYRLLWDPEPVLNKGANS